MGGVFGCTNSPRPQPQQTPLPVPVPANMKRRASFRSSSTKSRGVAVGQRVYCRLAFDATEGKPVYWKWEEAEVEDITGNIISLVVESDSGENIRISIDCGTDDLFNLATRDMFPNSEQIRQGGALSEDQRKFCCAYFDLTQGLKQAVVMPKRHDNLPVREAEGMLDAPATAHPIVTGISHKSNTSTLLNKSVLCRDKFKSKHSGQLVYKWRESQIIEVQGSHVKVRFVGWSQNHDVWKDLQGAAMFDLAPPDGVLDKEQVQSGRELDDKQREATARYLKEGVVSMDEDSDIPVITIAASALSAAVARPDGRRGGSSGGSGKLYHSYVAGQQVEVQELCRDNNAMPRWRPVLINKVRGDMLRVHFIGFDSSWDEDIDMRESAHRVRKQVPALRVNSNTTPNNTVDGQDSENSSGEVRRRQMSRRASFDPSKLDSYNRDNNSFKSGSSNVQSQKFRVPVEPTASQAGRYSFKGGFTEGMSQKTSPKVESVLPVEGTPNGETSELDTAAMWNSPSKAVATRREKAAKNTHHRTQTFPDPENKTIAIERYFYDAMTHYGYHIIEVEGDGNCLFRAVAHQIWLDEGRHNELRMACVEHMKEHRARYEVFCPMDYDEYLNNMSISGTWADDFEIRALEEMLDRLISIYSSDNKDIRPINKNFDEEYKLGRHVRPIIISYHGGNHYNSVFDERSPLPLAARTSHVILDMRTGDA